jgi:uncharacterized protein
MSGVDANTGKILDGWDHTVQSIGVCLTTALGTRVMRRDFGADLEPMIDRPLNAETMVDIIISVAEAIEPRVVGRSLYGEPRFDLRRIRFLEASGEGRLQIMLEGIYYPRGHLNDYSAVEQRSIGFEGLGQ